MNKSNKIIFMIIFSAIFSGLALAQPFSGGEGNSQNPYQISDCQELQNIHFEQELSAHYVLTADLNCSDIINSGTDGGEGFLPIGGYHGQMQAPGFDDYDGFNGVFDGQNYTIESIKMDWQGYYVGIFAGTGSSGEIRDINFNRIDSKSSQRAGGLVGRHSGDIKNVAFRDFEIQSENYAGGVVGRNTGGEIQGAKLFSGNVSATDGNAGGFTGQITSGLLEKSHVQDTKIESNDGQAGAIAGILNSNSAVNRVSSTSNNVFISDGRAGGLAGMVQGENNNIILRNTEIISLGQDDDVGAIVGRNYDDAVYSDIYIADTTVDWSNEPVFGVVSGFGDPPSVASRIYYDIDSTNWDNNDQDYIESLEVTEMIGDGSDSNMAFDFQDTWDTQSFYYPRLQWMEPGSGAENDSYRIFDCKELQALDNNLTAYYELANNIDCSETVTWDSGGGFEPIATRDVRFEGVLDGNNYIIDGLYIDKPSMFGVGLFAATDNPGEISNLGITNSEVTGDRETGLMVGTQNSVMINNSFAQGNVFGGLNTGGLVGSLSASDLYNSYSNVTVEATGNNAASLIGSTFGGGEIRNSYALGNVEGASTSGGLAGSTGRYYDIYESFADVEVVNTGSSGSTGGLIGSAGSTNFDTFALGDVTGGSPTGGLFGDCGSFCSSYRGFSKGAVTGNDVEGGLIGSDTEYFGSTISNSYWDTDSSGLTTSDAGDGLMTSEMQDCNAEDNLSGFDFENTWTAQDNDYPQLRLFASESLECDETPPSTPSLLLPSDSSSSIPVAVNLSVTAEGSGLQNISFYQNIPSGSDVEIGSTTGVDASNSEVAEVEWSGLDTNTQYEWYAVAENSDGSASSDVWEFTTEEEPWIENPRPNSSAVEIMPELNLTVFDDVDNVIDVSIYDSEDVLIGSSPVSSGDEASFMFNDANEVGETYKWYAVLETNSGIVMNSSASNYYPDYWSFTVVENIFRLDSTSEWLEGEFDGSAVWEDNDVLQAGYLSGEDETEVGGYVLPGLNSVVGQWRLNEIQDSGSVKDFSSVNNHGSAEGSPSVSSGIFDRNSVSLDGQQDFIDIPFASEYDLEAFTVSVWFRTSGLSDEIGVISNKQNDFNDRNWWIAMDNGQGVANQNGGIALRTSSGGEIVSLNAENDYRDGEWHHVVAVMDPQNNDARLYIDGELLDSEDQDVGAVDLQSSPIYLGQEVGANDRFFAGELSDHLIFGEPVNDSEAQQLYYNTKDPGHNSSYTSKTVSELEAQEWKSLNLSHVKTSQDTELNVTVEVSNDFSQGVASSQTFELGEDLNQALSLPETEQARIIFEGKTANIEESWSIDSSILIYESSSEASIDAEINPVFGDQVNMNSGTADIGKTILQFEPWNSVDAAMETVNVDVDGVQVAEFNDVSSNSIQEVDISSLGLSEDQVYSWSVSVEEQGLEIGSFNGEFSTHTVDIEAVPQDDSHDSINLYYSPDGASFSQIEDFTTSDSSAISVKAANPELYQSGNHCYTASASRSGLESSKSPEICIGGDIP